MSKNQLSEAELRRQYRERTCACGCSVSNDHHCFDGWRDGLTFVQWIARMAVKYPKLEWMNKR